MQGVYTVSASIATVTTAKTLIQIATPATTAVEILRAWITQSTVDSTDDRAEALLLRYDTAATVTSATPVKHNPLSQAAKSVGGTSATGTDASAEGTTNIENVIREAFSVLAGWVWLPTPEERIIVPPSKFVGLKSNITITSATLVCGVTFREIG